VEVPELDPSLGIMPIMGIAPAATHAGDTNVATGLSWALGGLAAVSSVALLATRRRAAHNH